VTLGRRLDGEELAALQVLKVGTAENASTHLLVAGVLAAARERYEVQVRTDDIVAAVAAHDLTTDEVAGSLRQLREWGVVVATLDTARVQRIEDFRRRREMWRLTPGGHAAIDAVRAVLGAAEEQGALHRSLLGQLRGRLEALAVAARNGDTAQVTSRLRDLDNDLRALATGARDFHAALAELRAQTELDPQRFLAFKDRLVSHLQSFVTELSRHRPPIERAIAEVEAVAGIGGLAALAAAGDDASEVGDTDALAAVWQRRWEGLVAWFVGSVRRPSGVDDLKRATTQALRELVGLLRRLTEAESRPITRASELRHLARWFLRVETDDDAHALFDAAIGLGSLRHLSVGLDDPESIAASTSWWDAPPVPVSITLRRTGQRAAPGNLFPPTDTTAQRRRLAAVHERRARQQAAAAAALLARPIEGRRLSEPERDLLLELLDRALHHRLGSAGRRSGAAAQGVRLELCAGEGTVVQLPGGALHLDGWAITLAPAG